MRQAAKLTTLWRAHRTLVSRDYLSTSNCTRRKFHSYLSRDWKKPASWRAATGTAAMAAALGAAAVTVSLSIEQNETVSNDNKNDKGSELSMVRENTAPKWPVMMTLKPSLCERALFSPRHTTEQRLTASIKAGTLPPSSYDIDPKPLGEGAYGAVYLATDRKTGQHMALKRISKDFTDDDSFRREIDSLLLIQQNGGHPNICGLRNAFAERSNYVLMLDLISGGEMFDHLINGGAYSEANAARLVREVASALSFIHGIGIVHVDLKPENLMLSTKNRNDAVIKLVDFGCAAVLSLERDDEAVVTGTIAYSPPEALLYYGGVPRSAIKPSFDMWSMGIILYVMLTGYHPFDMDGMSSDEEIRHRIITQPRLPFEQADVISHLSPSAIDLLKKLLDPNPNKRLGAYEMLQHPWVKGETARNSVMSGSAERLSKFRVFRSALAAKVFKDFIAWSDSKDDGDNRDGGVGKAFGLFERAFSTFDTGKKGYISTGDLARLATADGADEEGDASSMSLSEFADLLSEHMSDKYFPKNHIIYRENDRGDHMYFINSGTIEVSTRDGFKTTIGKGTAFGEGALLTKDKKRSATVRCVTPAHVIEVDRKFFNKYLNSPDSSEVAQSLREKVHSRALSRAGDKLIRHGGSEIEHYEEGDIIFHEGQCGKALYMLEEGSVDLSSGGHTVQVIRPGELCGLQAVMMKRPRSFTATCLSKDCRLRSMSTVEFHHLLKSSRGMKQVLEDMCLRRIFQKAVVKKIGKPFPSPSELKEAFDAIDVDKSGYLDMDEVKELLKLLDTNLTKKQTDALIRSLDLDGSGEIDFNEFKSVFGKQ